VLSALLISFYPNRWQNLHITYFIYPTNSSVVIFLIIGLYVMSKGVEKQPIIMLEEKKTTTFYVGLLALGFAINDFCFLVYYFLSNYYFAHRITCHRYHHFLMLLVQSSS
jgi:uncharacterized membrane protein